MSTSAAALAACMLVASPASAIESPFSMIWDASGDSVGPFTYDPMNFGGAEEQSDGSIVYTGDLVGETWELDWVCRTRDAVQGFGGPLSAFVDADLVVTNTSLSVQTFSMLMTLDLASSIVGPTSSTGSAGYTVTNGSFTGDATISTPAGSSLYRSFLDVTDPFTDPALATLFDAPFSDTVTGAFASSSGSDGFAGLAGPSVNTNIAILLTFTLSPGDSASVSGVLTVVPAPGAIALLGLAGLAGRRRRD